jgi:hypothetical protein
MFYQQKGPEESWPSMNMANMFTQAQLQQASVHKSDKQIHHKATLEMHYANIVSAPSDSQRKGEYQGYFSKYKN